MLQDADPGVRRSDGKGYLILFSCDIDVKRGYRTETKRKRFALTVLACQALGSTSSPLEGCLDNSRLGVINSIPSRGKDL